MGHPVSLVLVDHLNNRHIDTVSFALEIIKRVTECEMPPFRPTVVTLIPRVEELRELMKCCWDEKPETRPDFHDIKKTMHRILSNSGM